MIEKLNVFTAENDGRVDASAAVGSAATAMYLYDVEPGRSSCPYHYELAEEWALVLEGTIVVRTPGGEETLERGDLVCFAAGPDGAHKFLNRGDTTARFLVFSQSSNAPAVSVYPDSDKIGVWTSADDPGLFFKRGTAVPWSEGEEGWDRA